MSLVTTLKDLYYDLHRDDGAIKSGNDNGGSTRFVYAMRAVLDGNSDLIREPHPALSRYSLDHARNLHWRTILFGDQVALFCLRENVMRFYQP